MPRALRNCHRNRGDVRATASEVGYDELDDRLREISHWMTTVEAAKAADVTQRTIQNWVKQKLLTVKRVRPRWMVKYERVHLRLPPHLEEYREQLRTTNTYDHFRRPDR